jgi:hypothetical protein
VGKATGCKTNSDIVYFDSGGKHNTTTTLLLAKRAAQENKIKNIVIASMRGQTAEKALEIFDESNIELTFVGCDYGCVNCPTFSKKIKKKVELAGYKVIFIPEGSIPYPEAAQLAYRRICEGLKVCVHLAMGMAERELVPLGEEIIAVAGTGWKGYPKGGGVDTAVIIQALKSKEFFSYDSLPRHKLYGRKIKEILCKPR